MAAPSENKTIALNHLFTEFIVAYIIYSTEIIFLLNSTNPDLVYTGTYSYNKTDFLNVLFKVLTVCRVQHIYRNGGTCPYSIAYLLLCFIITHYLVYFVTNCYICYTNHQLYPINMLAINVWKNREYNNWFRETNTHPYTHPRTLYMCTLVHIFLFIWKVWTTLDIFKSGRYKFAGRLLEFTLMLIYRAKIPTRFLSVIIWVM